jgi:hypothetical protein
MADPVVQDVSQAAQAAAQAAAQNMAAQVAQQIAEQVGQAVSQAIQKFMQTTGAATIGTGVSGAQTTSQSTREELGDIGGTENIEANLAANTNLIMANTKRTYDEYQHESLESVRRNRSYVDKILAENASHDHRVRQIAEIALSNAVDTANLVNKQAVAHRDVAIDRTWNVDEVSTLTAKSGVQADTIQSIVAATVAATLSEINKQKAA